MTGSTQRWEEPARRAIALAAQARERGNHPFGAVLVGPDGAALLEAENTVADDGDVTGHAETNLVRLATTTLPHDDLPATTLVSSCEPCAMCAAAIYWAGIGRIVYALPEHVLYEIAGEDPENPTLRLPCRDVVAAGSKPVDVVGPMLEDEAAEVHRDFWA
ncbi:nucleoside deaminase [Serinibacter arcticus]|uniref:Nucleoside deaminase n=1 Tax=Serinibacter arcticus TaxID=1655435 RepID=A0A2U1ZSM9_9MICO|nr:nucleoside deaminase [Serinibacter arcticus]PWD49943.1 nucleoside deaminase [Serinibacter arcticus]